MIDCTKFIETLDGKPVAVFGLGLSGISTIKALVKAGAKVKAWDDLADTHDAASETGAEITHLDQKNLQECALLVLAPGVPLFYPRPHQVVMTARKLGMEIISDLEILHRCNHGCKTIGITGTNGKSTTTALIGYILESAGCSVAMGGNIGRPVLDLDLPKKDGFFVLEISSYQMDLCTTFTPDISVLLNITPDHLDRHGNFKNYAAAKERIFKGEGLAIISLDDEPCRRIYERMMAYETGQRRVRPLSFEGAVENGVFVKDGILFDARKGASREIGSIKGFASLRGIHNHQNAAAAYAVCASQDVALEPDVILEAMKTFPGLPHRQFQTRVINGIPYINDSKATNVEATSKALSAYRNIYWIAGGRPKGDNLEDISSLMSNVRHAFLIGEAMIAYAGWLDQYSVPYTLCGDLENAVNEAHNLAQSERGRPGGGGVVMLSPACASYDQFRSFEERGEYFTNYVNALDETQTSVDGAAA
ncbi:MAG TPA: UDP-N-acetylmuramoyl-L-alanine--D-glutamate ligase [Alphaproteobacteria bacterium]|nr:UDP-N-acetylmuramoyl-L-alanine--D-glutamate ligase [Alphaproteobacteria bacterium]USO04815.1 MAG: UDP-N-acetylmuramoyl-L-alanine--D-glutamate ligase [Rhodospirillales bacterium]HOO80879.1 UDP-N-acetylmuramoyl-L-alanine--D-glutamate ligase [Alphaproteobacteria bacterium]